MVVGETAARGDHTAYRHTIHRKPGLSP